MTKELNSTLAEVLLWLPMGYAITSGLNTGGFLTIDDGEMGYSCIQVQGINEFKHHRWDLSKPLLKDQSEELIDYLISIKSQS